MDHLSFLELHLSNARNNLAQAKQNQRELLAVFVAQCEKELQGELARIAQKPPHTMTDDEILAELQP